MYRVLQITVKNKKNKELFSYLSDLCMCYKNLKNVANFHIRQHMTGLGSDNLQPLQEESISLFKEYIPKLTEASKSYYEKRKANILADDSLSREEKKSKIDSLKTVEYKQPTKEQWFLSYNIIEGVLKLSENVDYRSLPAGVNQNAIKEVTNEWKSYFALRKKYNEDKSSLLGKPNIPKYLKGPTTVTLNNVTCKLKEDGKKRFSLRFPKTNAKLSLGSYFSGSEKLIEVKIKPVCDYFIVYITTEENIINEKETKKGENKSNKKSKRVISIDTGMKNIAAITNNVGLKPILIKGNVIAARNKFYLDKIAEEQSILNKGKDPNGKHKRINLKIKRLYAKRNRILHDYFHKACKYIILFCKENDIDTIIIGRNTGLKQNMNIGNSNQDFAYIPFGMMYNILDYLCAREGIEYIEKEESYTSKASFFDKDIITVYKKGSKEEYIFSGKRTNRDTYTTKNGYVLNADINGSLNIMRKYNEELTLNITICDVNRCIVLGYHTFYKKVSNKSRKQHSCQTRKKGHCTLA